MLSIMLSILVLLVVFAIFWVIIQRIPVPPDFNWLVQVILLVLFVMALIGILGGGLTFWGSHSVWMR